MKGTCDDLDKLSCAVKVETKQGRQEQGFDVPGPARLVVSCLYTAHRCPLAGYQGDADLGSENSSTQE